MVTNEDIGGQTGGHVIKPLKIKKTQNFIFISFTQRVNEVKTEQVMFKKGSLAFFARKTKQHLKQLLA